MVGGHTVGIEDRDADLRRTTASSCAVEASDDLPRIIGVDQRKVCLQVEEWIVGDVLVELELHQQLRLGDYHF